MTDELTIPDFDEFKMAALAREMAMMIKPYKDTFKKFGIDKEAFYDIQKHPFYKRAYDQFLLEWNSSLSSSERVKLISAAYAEEGLPTIGKRMLDPQESFSDVLDSFKTFCRNAGIGGDPKNDKPTGERFVITINLGGDSDGKPVIEHFDKPIEINPSLPKP